MATAKQPHPAAIRMMSNMSFLRRARRSADTEGIERHQHRQGEGEMQHDDDANLEQRVAGMGRGRLLFGHRPCVGARETKAVHARIEGVHAVGNRAVSEGRRIGMP